MKNTPASGENQSPPSPLREDSTDKPKQVFLFAMTPNDVMSRKDIFRAKNVFGVIFSLHQGSIGRCILSNESIAERTALSVQQIKRLFPVLEKAGLIKRIKKHGSECTRERIEVLWKPSSEPNSAVVATQPHREFVGVAGQPQTGTRRRGYSATNRRTRYKLYRADRYRLYPVSQRVWVRNVDSS